MNAAQTAWDEYWRSQTRGYFIGPSKAIRDAAQSAFMAGRESISNGPKEIVERPMNMACRAHGCQICVENRHDD